MVTPNDHILVYVLYYLLGIVISITIAVNWFFTGFPVHLTKALTLYRLNGKFSSWADWHSWVQQKSPTLGELVGCPICLGFGFRFWCQR